MFKVSLINPPERVLDGTYKHYLPFSLLYLAAYMEERGVDVDIIDVKPEVNFMDAIKKRIASYGDAASSSRLYDDTVKEIVKRTVASSPCMIGISCMSREYESVMRLASLLKDKMGVPIVTGGIHPSLYPEHFIYDKSPVDFTVIGEGEETLLELAKHAEAGKAQYDDVDGIAYLKDGMCRRTQIRTVQHDLSTSPIKAYRKLDMQFYARPHAYITRHVRISGVQVFTSRGCPYDCTFCSNAILRTLNKWSKPVRYRPVKSVVEEIVFLKKTYHIDGFYIMDDTFCVDRRYACEFCDELKKADLGLVWGVETRANLVDEPLIREMKEAGLVQIDVGVETGSDTMLKEIRKGITAKDTFTLFSLAHKYRLRTFASVILNLPNETREDLQATIDMLEKIRPSSGVIGTTIPLPKTELFEKYFASKLKNDKEIIEIFSPFRKLSRAADERFHFSAYAMDFDALVDTLTVKHYLFAELQLGWWYWKMFFRSKRKGEYIVSIMHGFLNVLVRMATRFRTKKSIERIA